MVDSSTVRKINKDKIRRLMRDGKEYTKQNIAALTGLSVATCNTLLNELERDHEVLGEKQRLNDVGRSTVVYHMNDDYEYYLCMKVSKSTEGYLLDGILLTPTNKVKDRFESISEELTGKEIKEMIASVRKEYPLLSHVVIGMPAIIHKEQVTVSEFEGLLGLTVRDLSREHLPDEEELIILLENDMHLKAYGYYLSTGDETDVVTLCDFHSHAFPATATVHKGTVVRGSSGFAGHVGYLPFGMSTEELLGLMKTSTCLPLISRVISSIVAILNPDKVIVSGDLIEERRLPLLRKNALKNIPEDFHPAFSALPDFDEFYLMGMFGRVIREKEKY